MENSKITKFRVWNPNYKTWCGKDKGDWWLGMEYNTGKLVCIVEGKIVDAPDYLVPQMFTGLHDRHGREIWEGDVVKRKYVKYQIIFEKGAFRRKPINSTFPKTELLQMRGIKSDYFEVIGNCFENPELLNSK